MTRLIVRRLLTAIPMLFVVSFAVFALLDLTPGDAAASLAGDTADLERIEEVRKELGLDAPLWERYWNWLSSAVTGDLGSSLSTGQSVASLIATRFPVTLGLVLLAVALSLVLSIVVAVVASAISSSRLDNALSAFCALLISLPPFWLGMMLAYFFGVQLGWLPALGYVPLSEGVGPWLSYLLLPTLALAAVPFAEMTMQLRAGLTDTMQTDYVLAGEARGLRRTRIVGKHALKNASIPFVTILGYRFAQLIGGVVTIEIVFAIPGIGRLATTSVLVRDVPVLLGTVIVATVLVILINLIVDASYGYFNPKVRS